MVSVSSTLAPTLASRLRRVVGLAAAYAGVGKVALLLALPPGFASPVWPPAGIALVAVLLWGPEVCPGVFLGSFVINTSVSLGTSGFASAALTGACIGIGAVAHALFGAALARRVLGPGNPLEQGRSIPAFLLLGGPIACIVSAVSGTTALVANGRVAPEFAPITAGTWWVGDTIGVLLFAPPMLAAFATREAWSFRRWCALTVPLAVCLAGVVVVFAEATSRAEADQRERFEAEARVVSEQLAASIERATAYTDSIGHVFGAVAMDRTDFRELVSPWIAANPAVEAFEWLPLVRGEDLAAFEEAAADPDVGPYHVFAVDAAGQRQRVTPADIHTPILFVEPYDRQVNALGYDLHANPERRAAEEAARDSGQVVGTAGLRLVLVPGEWGALLIAPAYRGVIDPSTLDARRSAIIGYTATVLRVDRLAAVALADAPAHDLQMRITDLSESPPRVLTSATAALSSGAGGETWTQVESFGGRAWRVEVIGRHTASWAGWAVLAAGLACTGLVSAFVVDAGARAIEVERIVRDRTTALARANDALTRSNLELQRFAYVASHDMREPLRTIACYAELLDRETDARLDDAQRGWLRRVIKAARRMQDMIQEILAFSRDERRVEVFEAVPLGEPLEAAMQDLGATIGEMGARIVVRDLPTARCDRVQTAQLFQNLLSNAIKFRRADAPPCVEVSGRVTSEGVEVSVADNGIGIDPSALGRAFEMFQKLHAGYPGSGIGLATCRRIVERHGGRIWAESQPGVGSVFRFTLPEAR